MNIKMLCVFAIMAMAASCKKDNADFNQGDRSPLSIEFDNIAGSSDLQLATGIYRDGSGESFSVSKLRYYVSQFVFTRQDGSLYPVPEDSSYFLIDESDPASQEALVQLPEGKYKTFTFTLGVDSLRSTMDIAARTGVLDPTAVGGDMYWGWNSGYIFFKMEGRSAAAPDGFLYHLGGFGGLNSPTINNLKTITLDLSARGMPQVKNGVKPNIHLLVDVLKFFDGVNTLSIRAHPMVMFEDYSRDLSANLPAMFVHDHTEN